ncbi:hypothetical protein [Microscilla marina]|uniref:Uncharacterized protein n=1 Tax=Microscilla marina ATCC 23134 TaxID=313606 RepID=A2A019_MICM2|nr:hypothetical protein [Microscilla marina]EAY24014.1 hypothetical protein M23134_06236 [Microscilla marina ATCC 23134]
MDSLGIDNNTREIVWKITPKNKKTKPKAKANAPKKKAAVAAGANPDLQALVEAQVNNLSSILFEKIQELEQGVQKLNAYQTRLEKLVDHQKAEAYTQDAVFEPWYL